MNTETREQCPECKQDIDPDVCHCGTSKKGHDAWELGHSFVAMGCICFYAKPSDDEQGEESA